MPTPNNLQIKLSEADLQKINDALDALDKALAPVLVTLTGKEVQRLPKASGASLPFMQKSLDLAEQHPQFAPGYVDIPGLRLDLKAWEEFQSIARRLQPLATNLAATNVKLGSKQGISGAQDAQDAHATLKTRFEQSKEKVAKPATPRRK
ncbi:hypothetical protein [Hymenobacter chitinivorans]|uniref:Uncharacterized protein n=1 Tax=Hymenobacter chitinivorans DSM 11115 TaxID=1121954 RepID=A0A2M9B9A9_9BACT|nr:hypothetical protein [Hymenobacter chitinivorans]PJJ54507.1 hypothetical protein CLV45_2848 [Hymenobacter chitinivorans DSM 11115]